MLILTMPTLNHFSDNEKRASQVTLQSEVYQSEELSQIKYEKLLHVDDEKRNEVREKIALFMKK